MNLTKIQHLSSFWIKIIAIITMTIDHVGLFLQINGNGNEAMLTCGYVFRIIGRLSLPLFIFLLIEGIYYTRNKWHYITRLSILLVSILIIDIILFYNYDRNISSNPFIDLTIIALFFALIREKDWKKSLSLLPLGYVILCTSIQIYEVANHSTVNWLPTYLRMDYSIFAFLLALGFYFAFPLAKKMSKNITQTLHIEMDDFVQTQYFRSVVNVLAASTILFVNLLFYLLGTIYVDGIRIFDYINIDVQSWSILSLLFILCYNGVRGYNAKWFNIASYMYFPLHIAIIFVIFQLIFNGSIF